jgi:hypothetical protein
MAQYEVELSDGTVATVESDHEPSDEEVLAAVEKVPKTTALGTAARSAALSALPSAAAAAAFEPSAAAGLPFAPLAGPLAPLVPLATGAVGSAIAGLGVGYLQRKGLEKAAPEFMETVAAGEQQHGLAASLGRIAGMGSSFTVAPGQAIKGLVGIPAILKGVGTEAEKQALKATAAQVGLQTGLTAAQSVATGQGLPSGQELLEAGGAATIFGRPRPGLSKLPTFLTKGKTDASRVKEATTLYGNVRTQQKPAERVSTEEGEPRVQSRPEDVAEKAYVPLTPEQQRDWYKERLDDPSLLDKAVQLSSGELAVPVGGRRTAGSGDSIHETPEEAEAVAKEIRGKPGFPDVRVRADHDENGDVQAYSVIWGTDVMAYPTLTERGRAYGYKESVLFREPGEAPLTPEGYRILGGGRFESDTPPSENAFNVVRITKGGKTTYKFRMKPEALNAELRAEAEREIEDERAAITEAERLGLEAKFAGDQPEAEPPSENVPFSPGQFMRPTGKGILIEPRLFHDWMREEISQLPPEKRAGAIRARLLEEDLHNKVINGLGGLAKSNEEAANYWNNLTLVNGPLLSVRGCLVVNPSAMRSLVTKLSGADCRSWLGWRPAKWLEPLALNAGRFNPLTRCLTWCRLRAKRWAPKPAKSRLR